MVALEQSYVRNVGAEGQKCFPGSVCAKSDRDRANGAGDMLLTDGRDARTHGRTDGRTEAKT